MAAQNNHPSIIIGMQCINMYKKTGVSDWTNAQRKGLIWYNIKPVSKDQDINVN